MSDLASVALEAFELSLNIKAVCQKGEWGQVTEVERDNTYRIVLKGHRILDPGKRWRSVKPRELRITE